MPQPLRTYQVEQLAVEVYATNVDMGRAAAEQAACILNAAVAARGRANLVLATGNSQLTFYSALCEMPEVAWSKVQVFHMDEYAGMKPNHPASFRRFLREKIINFVQPAAFHGMMGEWDYPEDECERYAALLRTSPIDLCCLGIGENGHLAFNDPPYADFDDPKWVKVVGLDEKSRRQQVGEGHFSSLDEVPTHALSMTIPALLSAAAMLCIVPEARKAAAVYAALNGPLTEDCPATILRQAAHCRLLLDVDSATVL